MNDKLISAVKNMYQSLIELIFDNTTEGDDYYFGMYQSLIELIFDKNDPI